MSKTQILGNVNSERLEDLVSMVHDLDRFYEFLEEGKDMVIVERRLDYLQRFIDKIPMKLLPEGTESVPLPSHTLSYQANNGEIKQTHIPVRDGTLFGRLFAYSRLKGRDNIVEKITRVNAKINGFNLNLEDPEHSKRLRTSDVYGFTFVTPDEKSCYELKSRVEGNEHLEVLWEKDTLNHIRDKYRAIHQLCFWHNGTPAMDQTKISVHYETLDAFKTNKKGTKNNPGLAHKAYTQWKLQQKHHQGNYQIIVVEGDEFTAPPAQIDNGYARYTVIPGKQTEEGLYVPKPKELVLPGGSLEGSL